MFICQALKSKGKQKCEVVLLIRIRSSIAFPQRYDDLESLILLSDVEVEELCAAIAMKPGHKKRFPSLLKREKEEDDEQKLAKKEEDDEQKLAKTHERKLAQARRRRELDAEETGAETEVGGKEQHNPEKQNDGIAKSSVNDQPHSTDNIPVDAGIVLPEGKRYGATIAVVFILCLP